MNFVLSLRSCSKVIDQWRLFHLVSIHFLSYIFIICYRERQRIRACRGSKRGKRFVASRLCARGVWKSGHDGCWGNENEELWWGLCSMTGDVAKAILKSITRTHAVPGAVALKIECLVEERAHFNLSPLKWVLMDLTPNYFNHIACQCFFFVFFFLNCCSIRLPYTVKRLIAFEEQFRLFIIYFFILSSAIRWRISTHWMKRLHPHPSFQIWRKPLSQHGQI